MIKKVFIIGVFVIFLFGSLLHFTFDWSGNFLIVGFFSAVNESVFEHTKLMILPIILYYLISYFILKKELNRNKYFTAMLISLGVSIVTIPLLYYFYTEAFLINLPLINIFLFFVSGLIGQSIAYHYYVRGNSSLPMIAVCIITTIIIAMYIYFTIKPLEIPLFRDPATGLYGINKMD